MCYSLLLSKPPPTKGNKAKRIIVDGPQIPKNYRDPLFCIGYQGKYISYVKNRWEPTVIACHHGFDQKGRKKIFFDIECFEKYALGHVHQAGRDIVHELIHHILNVRDKEMGELDYEFYKKYPEVLEREGKWLVERIVKRRYDFYEKMTKGIENSYYISQGLNTIIDTCAKEINLLFLSDKEVKASISCPTCGKLIPFKVF